MDFVNGCGCCMCSDLCGCQSEVDSWGMVVGMEDPGDFSAYIERQLEEALVRLSTCPRCGPGFCFEDEVCTWCGMHRDVCGPAPVRQMLVMTEDGFQYEGRS